jgi:hypothetical protein
MCRSRFVAFLGLVLALVATRAQEPAKGPVPASKLSTAAGAPVEVRLADGSSVRMNLTQPNVEILTKYGKLSIPANEVRKIEFGFRYPEGAEEKISELVNRLGDANYKRRESAAAELAPFREMAYPMLKRATKSTDAEMSKRASELVQKLEEKYPPEKLRFRDYDLVTAVDFTARGKIEAKTLQGNTPYFGEVRLQVAEVKALRSMAFGGETTVNVDASKHLDQAGTWFDTEVELVDDTPLEIVASGQVSLYRGGGYECGPKGHQSYSNGTHFAGALLGRVGANGEVFLIGDKYTGTPKGSGKLYLKMAHSPWPQQATGSYKVVITPNPIR